jgi:hypothetical protein
MQLPAIWAILDDTLADFERSGNRSSGIFGHSRQRICQINPRSLNFTVHSVFVLACGQFIAWSEILG